MRIQMMAKQHRGLHNSPCSLKLHPVHNAFRSLPAWLSEPRSSTCILSRNARYICVDLLWVKA